MCAAALALPDGTERVALGEVCGHIVREPLGSNGFGYDPIFRPDGHERTFAQLTAAEKDSISHRARALEGLVPQLRSLLG